MRCPNFSGVMFLIPLAFLASCQNAQKSNLLTDADRNEVIEAMESYRDAWKRNDSAVVMSFVSKEMILYMPTADGKPKIGIDSIRAFWFPKSDLSYPITEFQASGEQVEGNKELCIYSGMSLLSWHKLRGNLHYDSTTSNSEFLNVLRKEDGKWKLYRAMYNVKKLDYK